MKIIPKSSKALSSKGQLVQLVKGILCSCDARKPDKKFWGQNVDLGLVNSCFAGVNQTQVNICSTQNFLQTMIARTNRWSYLPNQGMVRKPNITITRGKLLGVSSDFYEFQYSIFNIQLGIIFNIQEQFSLFSIYSQG